MRFITGALLCWLGATCFAQTTFQEQAARLQNINAFLLDFRPATAPLRFSRSTLEVSFDLNPQPSINTRVGNKNEPIDPPSVVPKLRGRFIMKNGLFLGAAIAPGVAFDDYEADTLSLEAGYRFAWQAWRFGLRLAYTDGDVVGPITERDVEDRFVLTNRSADFSFGRHFGRINLYGLVGQVSTETELDVTADGVHLENEEDALYYGGGLTYTYKRWGLTLEQQFTDDYLAHVILGVGYRFGKGRVQ